jgi:hypothetical protein
MAIADARQLVANCRAGLIPVFRFWANDSAATGGIWR